MCYHSWKRIYLDPAIFFSFFRTFERLNCLCWILLLFLSLPFAAVLNGKPGQVLSERIEFRWLLAPRTGKAEASYKPQIFERRTWPTPKLFRIALCIMLNCECSAKIVMMSLLISVSRTCANIYVANRTFEVFIIVRYVYTDANYCAVWVQIGDRSHDDQRVLCRSVNVKIIGTTHLTAVTQLYRLQNVEYEWSRSWFVCVRNRWSRCWATTATYANVQRPLLGNGF
jgi:hypothetical protein